MLKNRLYECVTFSWGTHVKEQFQGNIAQPFPFILNWPGHVNHNHEVYAVALADGGGVLFVRPDDLTMVPE